MPKQRTDGLPTGVNEVRPGLWRARVRKTDGSWRWQTGFSTPGEASAYRTKNLADYEAGILVGPVDQAAVVRVPTFKEFYEGPFTVMLQDRKLAPSTNKRRRDLARLHLLKAKWTQLPIDEVTSDLLREWFAMRSTGVAPTKPTSEYDFAGNLTNGLGAMGHDSLTRLLRLVRWVFIHAMSDSNVPSVVTNPAVAVVLPRLEKEERAAPIREMRLQGFARVVELEFIPRIITALDWVDLLPFWLCFIGGMRISEVFGLRVGDWEPQYNRMWVEEQSDDAPWTDANGVVRRDRPWTKSDSGVRRLYLPARLGALINDYIARIHGADAEPDTRICVGLFGPKMSKQAGQQFRKRLKRAIAARGIKAAFTRRGQEFPLLATPHDLRSTIASELEDAGFSQTVVGAFLGHKAKVQPGASETTSRHYLKASDKELRRVGEALTDILDGLELEELAPAQVDLYVTVAEAATMLAMNAQRVRKLIGTGVLTGHRNLPRHVGVGHREGQLHLLRADVTKLCATFRPAPEEALGIDAVVKRLDKPRWHVLRLTREDYGNELTRWTPPDDGPTDDIYVLVSSVEAFEELEGARVDGSLLGPTAAARVVGVGETEFGNRVAAQLTLIRHDNHDFYNKNELEQYAKANRPAGHLRLCHAARSCRLPVEEFLLLAGKPTAHLTADDSDLWVPESVRDNVRAAYAKQRAAYRDQMNRLALANPVVNVFDPPDTAQWVPAADAANQLGFAERTLVHRFAAGGLPRLEYGLVTWVAPRRPRRRARQATTGGIPDVQAGLRQDRPWRFVGFPGHLQRHVQRPADSGRAAMAGVHPRS